MESKIFAGIVCALLFVQTISAQCRNGNPWAAPLAFAPELSRGSSFSVQSASPIAPTGVTILSDRLAIEGPLVIDGQLPFLGTVALEGALPGVGVGSVSHSCGGPVAIISEGPAIAGASVASGLYGAGPLGAGYGAPGLGCRRLL